MTQQLEQLITDAWEQRAQWSAANAPAEVRHAVSEGIREVCLLAARSTAMVGSAISKMGARNSSKKTSSILTTTTELYTS